MQQKTFNSTEHEQSAEDDLPESGIETGTIEDREAMRRLGKEQVFKVVKFLLDVPALLSLYDTSATLALLVSLDSHSS